jgi:sugar transferase (PEP-CTERM/EpsH1 system associated)
MKICFVCPYTPTLVRTRPFNLVRTLVRHGHQVTLATLWENEQERQAQSELARLGVEIITAYLSRARSALNLLQAVVRRQPLQSLYCWHSGLARQIVSRFITSPWDVVHVEHLRGAEYGLYLRHVARMPVPIVWDSVDCISFLFDQAMRSSRHSFGRWITRLELPRTRRHEAKLLGCFERVLVTSPQDRAAFVALADSLAQPYNPHHLQVLSNGVDLDYFRCETAPRDPHTLVLTGKMNYHANVTAALYLVNEIMPRVWQVFPDACVEIVGQNPPPQIQRLAQQSGGHVQVTGTVIDIRPFLARATLAVAPILYGAGIQNKVLEAMAMATPVVATSKAVSALKAQSGVELLVADTPDDFAHAILQLLRDATLRESLGRQGRCYVEEHHNWHKITSQLEQVYESVVVAKDWKGGD